jgi:hypothetical protein
MRRYLSNAFARGTSRALSLLNLHISQRTDDSRIRDLASRLVPHDLGVPLRRLGASGDGGYLIPDDLDGVQHCFSPGVADTADFEDDLYDLGIPSSLADYSVDGPPTSLRGCDFIKKFVGAAANDWTIAMDEWVRSTCPNAGRTSLILQMDIEAAEYETLLATSSETLSRFRIIVLELHALGRLTDPLFFRFVEATMNKLLEQFEVAHLHVNNAKSLLPIAGIEMPQLLEITLLHKDRVKLRRPVTQLPHPLDKTNVKSRPNYMLPDYWRDAARLRNAA